MAKGFVKEDIVIDYTNALERAVGSKHGATKNDLAQVVSKTAEVHQWLSSLKESGAIGFFNLPKIDTKPFKKEASRLREKYENFVVLGIGGSALGTSAVQSALNSAYYNSLGKRKRNGYPKLFVVDNIDPDWFDELLGSIDFKKTIFNVISKSGSTAETMSQFMIIKNLLEKKFKGKWKKKILLTTSSVSGVLREIADEHKLKTFEVPENVGGRFSLLSAVGLLPLASAGIDIDLLLEGAKRMAMRCLEPELFKNPAYIYSAIHYIADVKKGKNMSVMMPYSSKLYGVADWYRQLWAESLGKRYGNDESEVYTGQTPIKALGATDQHSQVQLYVEGPFDKIVTFIEVAKFKKRVGIPEDFVDKPALKYLGGKSLNELLKTEMRGTEYALTSHNRPNLTISLPDLNPYTLGQLLYLLEVATAFSGGLYGIDPFDQPGVEFGKQYTYAMLGREGFEEMKAKIEKTSGAGERETV